MSSRSSLRRLSVLVVAALAFGAVLPSGAVAQAPTTLKIAAPPSDLGAEVYYAKELGQFKNAGLDADITQLTNGPAIISAVAGGSLDIGWSNVISLAQARERGIPVTILASAALFEAQTPTSGLLAVAAGSPIRTAKDLDGKTIAVLSLGNLSEASVRQWMDGNGGDSKSIKLIELPYAQMADAVRSHRVDAASMDNTADPMLGKPGDDLRVIAHVYDAVAPRFAASVWFTTTDWVQKHPDAARKFVAIMKQTAQWAAQHHRESAQILAHYTKFTVEQIESSTRVDYGVGIPADFVQPSIDIAARYGLIKNGFPARELISAAST